MVKAPLLGSMFNPPVPTRTVRNWQAARIIPFYKVGRAVLFDPNEVFAHLTKHNRIEPVGERGSVVQAWQDSRRVGGTA